MAYFNHAFKKVMLGIKGDQAGAPGTAVNLSGGMIDEDGVPTSALATAVAPYSLGVGTFGIFDPNTYLSMSVDFYSSQENCCPFLVASASVKTHDKQGQLLHFYYENKDELLSISLNDNRTLETEDILPHQLRFRSRYEDDRSRALEETGIIYKAIAYHTSDDNHVFLRIGDLESEHFALLNPKTYDLISIHNRLWLEDETWLELKIVFKNYETYRWQTYAKVTEHFLGNRIFKRTTVSKIRTLSRLPIKELQEQAWKLRHLQTATLQNNHAL